MDRQLYLLILERNGSLTVWQWLAQHSSWRKTGTVALPRVGMIDVNCGAFLPDGGGFLWVESSRGDAASSRVCFRELRLDTGVPECANNVCDLLTNTLSSSNCK